MLRTLGAAARSGAEAERARRAQLEALQARADRPANPHLRLLPTFRNHRDISLGRLLDGANAARAGPAAPSVTGARGSSSPGPPLARAEGAAAQDRAALTGPRLRLAARSRSRRRRKRQEAAPDRGARRSPPRRMARALLRLRASGGRPDGPAGPARSHARAWNPGASTSTAPGLKRAGYALAGRIGARLARIEVARPEAAPAWREERPRASGSSRIGDGGRRLQITVAFAARGDLRERCGQPARLVVLGARPGPDSTARLDPGAT